MKFKQWLKNLHCPIIQFQQWAKNLCYPIQVQAMQIKDQPKSGNTPNGKTTKVNNQFANSDIIHPFASFYFNLNFVASIK